MWRPELKRRKSNVEEKLHWKREIVFAQLRTVLSKENDDAIESFHRLSPCFLADVAGRGPRGGGRRMKIEEQQIACHSVKSASGRGAQNALHLMASIDTMYT